MIEIEVLHTSGDSGLDTEASIDAILAAMLWPQDETARERFTRSRYVFRRGGVDPEEIRALALKVLPRGLASGMILFNCISKLHYGQTFKMSDFKSAISELDKFGFAQKTIDNDIWPKYRRVSPLWAAHLWLVACGFVSRSVVPCTNETVSDLVAAAEALKKVAQRSHTPRSRERVLLRAHDDYHLSDKIMQLVSARPASAVDLAVKLNQFPN